MRDLTETHVINCREQFWSLDLKDASGGRRSVQTRESKFDLGGGGRGEGRRGEGGSLSQPARPASGKLGSSSVILSFSIFSPPAEPLWVKPREAEGRGP